MKTYIKSNKRWFTFIGLSVFLLVLVGIAVPRSYTAAQAFTVSLSVGATQTCRQHDAVVTLTATVDPPQTATFRWDWNNDGIYDTRGNTVSTIRHLFQDQASITVGVQARNSAGQIATNTVTFNTRRCGP